MKKGILCLMACACLSLLSGCLLRTCRVDYDGGKQLYKGAKDRYFVGQTVTLRYDMIATDTDYSFYLDDESLDYTFENDAIVLRFTMPDHDVRLSCRTRNSMVWQGPEPRLALAKQENEPAVRRN